MNGKAGAAFRHSRSLAEDIHRMACNARQVRAFTGGEMVFQIQGEGVSVHRVDLVAQKQGALILSFLSDKLKSARLKPPLMGKARNTL